VTSQSAQSVQSSMDMTRMIMERNVQRPALVGGASASAGAARTGAGAAGGSLGAAAGPLGIAAIAGAMAGTALESGGRWMAGQAATGGGVFGDVDAPHVPSPPVSRTPYYGNSRQLAGTQTGGRAGSDTAQPSHISVVQTQPNTPARTPLPASGPHLIIPGSVVADRDPAQLGQGPKALPGKEDRHD
jgi:hypothetical protein